MMSRVTSYDSSSTNIEQNPKARVAPNHEKHKSTNAIFNDITSSELVIIKRNKYKYIII